MSFSSKDPSEIITLAFDFSALTSAPTSPTVEIAVQQGDDSNPASMITSSPTISGMKVLQIVSGGVDGCTYHLRCTVSAPDGSRYVLADSLPVTAL